MVTRNTKKRQRKAQAPVHRIGSQRWAAKQLGVNRVHLCLVLNGHRESKRLTRRYNELMATLSGQPTDPTDTAA